MRKEGDGDEGEIVLTLEGQPLEECSADERERIVYCNCKLCCCLIFGAIFILLAEHYFQKLFLRI